MSVDDRLTRLESSVWQAQLWMLCQTVLIVALLIRAACGNDADLANADRQQFPPELWPSIYYASIEHVAADDRVDLETALRLVIPSTSRQVVLERCLPVQVGPTLYRLHLDQLQWSPSAWQRVIARHPYTAADNPLMVRGDWLLLELADSHNSDAYYSLLFGDLRTREAVLASLGVDANVSHRIGLIEGASTVSVQGVRWIENRPVARGYAWLTRDATKLDAQSDMLERPDGSFQHDGEEIIVGIRKVHLRTGTQGALQVYFLANGQGTLVGRAPVDLVADHTHFRGLREIRAPGSCVQCHDTGLNPLKRNELRHYVESGVEAYARDERIEAFHFAELETERLRNSSDFQAMVSQATGVESSEAAQRFRSAVGRYDRRLELQDAARELRTTPNELRLALGWAAANGYELGARVSGLAHGEQIPRAAWEQSYLTCNAIVADWRSKR